MQGPDEEASTYQKRARLYLNRKYPGCHSYLFGWIPLIYSGKGLSFFEAGATWIEEIEGIPYPVIQLRPAFLKKNQWLFYTKEEVLRHELVHAYRAAFEEPKFEEFFAYRTSKTKMRRIFGPLFQNPKEAYFFLVSSLSGPMFSSFLGLGMMFSVSTFFLTRLFFRHIQLRRAIKKYGLSQEESLALSDAEIQWSTGPWVGQRLARFFNKRL